LEDIGVDEGTTLKWILVERVWNGFNWLRIRPSGGIL